MVSFWLIRFLNLLCVLLLLIFLVRKFNLLFFGVPIANLHLTGPVNILYLLLLEIRIRLHLIGGKINVHRRLILCSTHHLLIILRGSGLREDFRDIPRRCYLVGLLL